MYYLHTPRLFGIINSCNTVPISCEYKILWIFICTWDLWFFTVIINLLWKMCVILIIYITIVLISYLSEQTGSYRFRFCFRSTYVVDTMKEWSAYFGLLPRINAYLVQLASSSIHWYGLQGLQKFWLDITTFKVLDRCLNYNRIWKRKVCDMDLLTIKKQFWVRWFQECINIHLQLKICKLSNQASVSSQGR